jgi:hypothetical protein
MSKNENVHAVFGHGVYVVAFAAFVPSFERLGIDISCAAKELHLPSRLLLSMLRRFVCISIVWSKSRCR